MPSSRYRTETRLVHAGTVRSEFAETSEALFLTQGYVYENSAQAERRFKNEEPGYQYSRFSNPTVSMFEARMAALEGAEAARATATGMAAVTVAILGQLKAGDHVVAAKALFGSCRYVIEDFLPRYGISSTLVEAYVSAAQKISRLAIGEPEGPTLAVYRTPENTSQNYHIEGLPFGTRGGLLVKAESALEELDGGIQAAILMVRRAAPFDDGALGLGP